MIGGHPAFQVPEGKTIYDYTLVFNKEGKESGKTIRRSFTIWRPMTRDIRWRKRPAA